METTILQVPLSKKLKSSALDVSRDYGFSSLQELVRVLLTKVSHRQLAVTFEEPAVKMSKKAERRYGKMTKDFETGKNVKSFSSVEELMRDLRS